MPSPFPGMDPYIETPEVWGDFHGAFAAEIRAALNKRLRPRYVARMTPYVTYESIELTSRVGVRPDVGLYQPRTLRETTLAITPPVAESAIETEVPVRLYSIEIHATDTMELITAIEILSPVNKKRGHEAYTDYLRKRRELFRSGVHFIEIDLLRAGERPPLAIPVPPAPYYINLSRANKRPQVDVWAIQLSDPLPVLPIPLREPDPDAPLNLPEIFATVYEQGGYEMLIDYNQPPPSPKFSESEADWLKDRLK